MDSRFDRVDIELFGRIGGKIVAAKRVRQPIGAVMRWAVTQGLFLDTPEASFLHVLWIATEPSAVPYGRYIAVVSVSTAFQPLMYVVSWRCCVIPLK